MDDAFGHWLAGFIDGEACFDISRNINSYMCRLTIALRDDDSAIFHVIAEQTGVGRVKNGQTRWLVRRKAEVMQIVEILDRYPLRSKKARDYIIWREAVMVWNQVTPYVSIDPAHHARLTELKAALMDGRRYHTPEVTPA